MTVPSAGLGESHLKPKPQTGGTGSGLLYNDKVSTELNILWVVFFVLRLNNCNSNCNNSVMTLRFMISTFGFLDFQRTSVVLVLLLSIDVLNLKIYYDSGSIGLDKEKE